MTAPNPWDFGSSPVAPHHDLVTVHLVALAFCALVFVGLLLWQRLEPKP